MFVQLRDSCYLISSSREPCIDAVVMVRSEGDVAGAVTGDAPGAGFERGAGAEFFRPRTGYEDASIVRRGKCGQRAKGRCG